MALGVTMIKPKPIPRSIVLPGPREQVFEIKIRRVNKAVLDKNQAHADYDRVTHVIRLPKRGSRAQLLFFFYHELGHAFEDYRLWLLQELQG